MSAYKVAIASSDGKSIDLHFGKCSKWLIVRIDGGTVADSETLELPQACTSCGSHNDAAIDSAAQQLNGCQAVLAARVGPAARNRLESAGLVVFEVSGSIHDALERMAKFFHP